MHLKNDLITKEKIMGLLNPRKPDTHKGTYGHALLVAGKQGTMGAGVIAARACLRSGVGLLTVHIPKTERFILQTTIPEAMLHFRKERMEPKFFSAVGIGPAIGTGIVAEKLLTKVLKNFECPKVIDADALSIIAKKKSMLELLSANCVLTPHPKEFDRIFGTHNSVEERQQKAVEISNRYPFVLLLKGHQTLVVQSGKYSFNSTGNAGLAKGGTGDMLTGMITALLAQGYTSIVAAQAGVYLHGLAADLAIEQQSVESLLATDVIENIGRAFYHTWQ